jgi:hypothetical protein
MAFHTIQDTNCAARVIPTHSGRVHPDRVIAAAPHGCESPARPVRFARVLQRENQTPYAFGAQSRAPEIDRSRIVRGTDSVELSERAKLLPKLGDMAPITPDPIATPRVVTTQQQHSPATGRVLDLYV